MGQTAWTPSLCGIPWGVGMRPSLGRLRDGSLGAWTQGPVLQHRNAVSKSHVLFIVVISPSGIGHSSSDRLLWSALLCILFESLAQNLHNPFMPIL